MNAKRALHYAGLFEIIGSIFETGFAQIRITLSDPLS
jgi:hypothetical protein